VKSDRISRVDKGVATRGLRSDSHHYSFVWGSANEWYRGDLS